MSSYRLGCQKVHKLMIQPINVIFRHLQNRTRVSVWIFEQARKTIEGVIIGFDEFMNIMLDEATEVVKNKDGTIKRLDIGRILLKGDSVTLIQPILA